MRLKPVSKLPLEKQRSFWRKVDSGALRENPKRAFFHSKPNAPIFVSPHTVGHIRRFNSREDLARFIGKVNSTNKFIFGQEFDFCEFEPTQLLSIDRKNLRMLEVAHIAPNVSQVLHPERPQNDTPYARRFWKKMRQKFDGWKPKDIRELLKKKLEYAYFQIERQFQGAVDVNESNLLVLDFDFETGKPVLAIIDHHTKHPTDFVVF